MSLKEVPRGITKRQSGTTMTERSQPDANTSTNLQLPNSFQSKSISRDYAVNYHDPSKSQTSLSKGRSMLRKSRDMSSQIKLTTDFTTQGDESSAMDIREKIALHFTTKPMRQKLEFLRLNIGLVNYETNHLLRPIGPTTTHRRMLSKRSNESPA